MGNNKSQLVVAAIENGTVIDHIPAEKRHHGVAAAKGKGTDLKKGAEQFSGFGHRHPSMFLLLDRLQLQIALESRFVRVPGNKVPAII